VIIEIGDKPFIARAFPKETAYFSTIADRVDPGFRTLGSLAELWAWLGRADVDLIVCHPTFSAPWSWRHLGRILFSRRALAGRLPLLRSFGPQLLRWRGRAPIAVLDQEDLPVINRNNLFLLDRSAVFYKRELPVDRWRVFLKTAHANLPTARFREAPRQRARIEKLAPISLGLPMPSEGLEWPSPVGKRADVFFAGRIEGSSSLRPRGLAELEALGREGVVVDIPKEPLPRDAFYRRCSEAHLVWSPEGFGWECFRHYEALACGSVPLINLPTIERHRPLVAGEHALYYDPAPGGLTRAVREALADRTRLTRIARSGRDHVMAQHTASAIARYVVETTRGGRTSLDY
jgi:hypothetical protein